MTTIQLTEHGVLGKHPQIDESHILFYGSTPAQISEETEYIKKIRSTLKKIRKQIFKEDIENRITNHKQEAKQASQTSLDGSTTEEDKSFYNRYHRIVEKIKDKELQLLSINKENQQLQIKLEATREAGAEALRTATRKLYDSYQKRSDELKKTQHDTKHTVQVHYKEQEEKFKQNIESINQVADRLQEKHTRILELEKLVERMEEERSTLLEKKEWVEKEIQKKMANSESPESCMPLRVENSTLQEQIYHLQKVILYQHQLLRNVIHETETLNNELQRQDQTIDDLKSRIVALETQNRELKDNVEYWSIHSKLKNSKAVSVNESAFEIMSPYFMLLNLRKQKT
ncbi:coiled-coil domain-containing protein 68 [Microcaecilia unicolor]|uniref:Coiled-coil domain-containing protein 68 n=1 Tax=Microcaecilia unicolor TaxID=1415580 RepID=A0A6P7XDZ0_9AMPH|nr:coiled-coil domain-containing protein 68 [Microcaecilia unicolor]XP_030048827.1 coiled-coil domain-containing protein 68 [Microcaecilia unicolor]XP_030048828.1 coiled-coil domain-containing protein 68 [Microcaecilia unicolor]XP_030048829.1 coiled-coil domain-containing protein 68 [Microcaecilia unicolor]XP_030048830.1 coiled-coil domain-containing protein 68 [Microcaecilia unicolor]XP_030048832.1 coiled-coil domain-containing protein 68 [Microcaecilia unicolor]